MKINENIRDKRKGGILSKLPIYLLLTIVDYKTWYQIKAEALYFDPKWLKYTKNLIWIFMNINVKV